MKRFKIVATALLMIVAFANCADGEPPLIAYESPSLDFEPSLQFSFMAMGYESFNISNFHILLQKSVISNNIELANEVLNKIQSDLDAILALDIKSEKKDELKRVPIFVDLNTTNGAAVYHPSEDWLRENNYPIEKAKAVEISNINNFLDWTELNQPFMLLHELTHAYHDRVLGFDHPDVLEAYNLAVSNYLYLNVNYHAGNGNYFTQSRAYALNNQIEFLAEITEAYFGENDYYPFTRTDLQAYDSLAYSMVEKVWGH